MTDWKAVADMLAVALRGWERLDNINLEVRGRNMTLDEAEAFCDALFDEVWSNRDDALEVYDAAVSA